jgi:hypothetical protein
MRRGGRGAGSCWSGRSARREPNWEPQETTHMAAKKKGRKKAAKKGTKKPAKRKARKKK